MAVDAVITWVDGSAPAHRRQLAEYLTARGGTPPHAASATRFDDAGELALCLASILRFAPWFRRIHIVTVGQTPALMRHFDIPAWRERVRLVDHREIFAGFERHLPTFNSRSIISLLWRIPELAEQFVYFNDDFMLLRPVGEDDFFRAGRMVLRGRWRLQARYSLSQALRRLRGERTLPGGHDPDAGARQAQELAARMVGNRLRYFRLAHAPYPMRRSPLERHFAAYPQRLDANVRHRLRSAEQFKTECLAAHLGLAAGEAVVDHRLHAMQIRCDCDPPERIGAKIAHADRTPDVAFACVQSLDLAPAGERERILAWLRQRIGRIEDAMAAAADGASRDD